MLERLRKYKSAILVVLAVILIIFSLILGINQYKKYYNLAHPNKIINIVFNTDASYTEYTKVAIKSAIMTKNKDSIYKINVLCVDLPKNKMEEFKALENKKLNVSINPIPLKLKTLSNVGNYKMDHYVTRADLFKFLMPDIFPKLDKILYIDGDTIILKDLSELYNTDISRNYIGAVMRYDYDYEWKELLDGTWDLKKTYKYNCGVILFNLKKWRKGHIKEKLIEAKNKDKINDLMTQRSFNEVIPINKIKRLSPIYNTIGRMTESDFKVRNFKLLYKPYCDNINSAQDLFKQAVIVHWAGHKKPWSYKDVNYADKWWYFARKINPNWQLEPDRTH